MSLTTEATLPVRVTQVPGRSIPVLINEGGTVRDALAEANVSAEGMQIRVGGREATLDTPLSAENNAVILSRQVKGN